jgi:glycosyltransferase involved in cell wall biosynthesis
VPWSDYATALKAATAESPASRRERGTRAREWAVREFSWDTSARNLAAFYTQLTDRPA